MLDELKDQLARAQNRMKNQTDKHRKEVEFQVVEKVYKLQLPSATIQFFMFHFSESVLS